MDSLIITQLEMELVFTITTQNPNSNPLSGKAYPLHVCRKQDKSHQTFVTDGAV